MPSTVINGHAVSWTKSPAWSDHNAYLLWMLYREALKVHAVYPLISVTIVRDPGSPPYYRSKIDVAANGDWTLHIKFDDLLNPRFGVEETSFTAWPWRQVEATRNLRSAIVELLMADTTLIDNLVITFT